MFSEHKTKILELVAEGWTDTEIANELGVSRNTVVGTRYRAHMKSNQKTKEHSKILYHPIVDLTSTTCPWPYGDPKDWRIGEFRYCMEPKNEGSTYCTKHQKNHGKSSE